MNLPNNNSNTNNKYSRELIEIRRLRVLELISKATSQSKIAEQLGVSQATVSLDLQYVKENAHNKMKTHIEERIPMQYEECLTGLKLILRKTYEIVEDKSKRSEEHLAAMNLAVNIYGKLMDLSTNGGILEKTLAWIEDRKKLLPTVEEQKKIDEVLKETSTEDEDEDAQEIDK
jgi:predicted transcriptional regulator